MAVLAKVAVVSDRISRVQRAFPEARVLLSGSGWVVRDVVCTAGPGDIPFEEQHRVTSVALVVSGSFVYRTRTGLELMTPGSLLLGNAGDSFVCGHEHGVGDRCLSFSYTEEFCEQFEENSGPSHFRSPRIPPIRALSSLAADASELLTGADRETINEIAVRFFGGALRLQRMSDRDSSVFAASSFARVTRAVRAIEAEPGANHSLKDLAAIARLSQYHFLRTFRALTGSTPRQYLLRTRLRRAAERLKRERTGILEIGLDCGFSDASNFSRAFRSEFGVSPQAYRR